MGTFAILGASGTIGSQLAIRLVEQGHRVLLVGRSEQRLSAVASCMAGQIAICQAIDFTSSDQLRLVIEAQLGQRPLSGIVNCIGSILLKPSHGTSDAEFRATVETNLFTAFATVKVASLLMRKEGGSVVLVSSAAAEIGLQNHEAIASAKAGIIGLARSAAATYAPSNIRFNVVSPGLTCTELTRRIWDNPANAVASTEMHPLGRLGQPHHIVSAICWLLDPSNDWITGDVLHVDGGLSQLVPRRRN